MASKRSFFERLTGTVALDDYNDSFEEEETPARRTMANVGSRAETLEEETGAMTQAMEEDLEEDEGQLSVDVYQTPEHIIIRAVVAGVRPDHLDVSITRDMITIRGKREEHKEVNEDDYFYRELYWGSFSRTILLPQEVEVEEAEAKEKHGVLTIKLPKIDKDKETKLKVKSN
ncbi:MAG: Hsp20/alpha crystallin family protein [Parcubacteria group bacterium]|nr:Hsp20/alpha crystallin family protein [Parcubacteria group bacterium]